MHRENSISAYFKLWHQANAQQAHVASERFDAASEEIADQLLDEQTKSISLMAKLPSQHLEDILKKLEVFRTDYMAGRDKLDNMSPAEELIFSAIADLVDLAHRSDDLDSELLAPQDGVKLVNARHG